MYVWLLQLRTDTYAQNTETTCENMFINVDGIQEGITGATYTFWLELGRIATPDTTTSGNKKQEMSEVEATSILRDATVRFSIFYENTFQQTIIQSGFFYSFPRIGTYKIEATVTQNGCTLTTEKEVRIFKKMYTYIGTFLEDFNFWIVNTIKQKDTLLHTVIIANPTTSTPDNMTETFLEQKEYIQHAPDIFIYFPNYSTIFDALAQLQDKYGTDISNKRVFFIDDTNKSIVKKFLARFIKQTRTQSVFVLNKQELGEIFLHLSIGKDPYSAELLDRSRITFNEPQRRNISPSQLVDNLVFHGFPLDTMQLLLWLIFAIVFLVFVKHVVWLTVFGVYYPLLTAVSFHTVWMKTTLGLFAIALVARICVQLLTKNFTLLVSAKYGLYLAFYIACTVIGLTLYSILIGKDAGFLIYNSPMIIIPYITTFIASKQVLIKHTYVRNIRKVLEVCRFIILSFITYLLIKSSWVHYLVLVYPSLIIIIGIIIIMLGRYRWLQLTEYIRFRPVITKGKKFGATINKK